MTIELLQNKRQPAYFRQWSDLMVVTTNFFYGPDSADKEAKDEMLTKIRRLLKLHGSESSLLMQLYLHERCSSEENAAQLDAQLGTLTVRALFVGDKLVVEVLNGRNLKPMDARKLSDPYVKIQLSTQEKIVDSVIYKTKVHKHTIFPLFDELFTL